MPRLTNFKIAKVFKGKSGEGEYGPWIIYNFYVQHFGNPKWNKVKFGYLHGGNKAIPIENSEVDYIEYEVVREGKYTNYRVKTLALKECEPEPEPEPEAEPEAEPESHIPLIPFDTENDSKDRRNDRDISFYVSYAKDLQVARLPFMSKTVRETVTLGELTREVVLAGKAMLELVRDQEIKIEESPIDESGPFQEPGPEDDIPI